MNSSHGLSAPSFSDQTSYLMGFKEFNNGHITITCPEPNETSVDFSGLNDPYFNPSEFVKSTIKKLQTNQSAATLVNSHYSTGKENEVTHFSEKNPRSGPESYSNFSTIQSPNLKKKKREFGRLISPKHLRIISPSKNSKLVVKEFKTPLRDREILTEISPERIKIRSFYEKFNSKKNGKIGKVGAVTVLDKETGVITTSRETDIAEKRVVTFTKIIGNDKITVISERVLSESGKKCNVVTKTIIGKCSTFHLNPPR